ncbi:hypothetical protein C2845_PM18G06290 [Panicum miliaceum]|uniref:CCHC-type domain-containing protein n=1 Tax=Panicum miliaceum TaxID=4540 RepID=A0A3L6PLL6_PANMI|nr:hypothetical protein C2845_PM18G06290 [Panicum miliaceum]
MTAEARQCYYLDINKNLSTQETFQKGVTQYQDGTQTMNLEDWSISFKEFRPSRIKQRKKQASEESQEKMELPEPLVHSSTQPCSNQLQPKVVQLPHDNSIKKNPDAQIASRRSMVEQKGSQNGYVKGVRFKCGEEDHYVNKCPTKRKVTWSCDAGLYCLKCGEDGHLDSWCAKEDGNQPLDQSPNSPALSQMSSVCLLSRVDDQDTSTR